MKFFHLSDLHLGRRIYEFSLIDDQKYILKEILRRTDEERPDAVVIAGDIYDRAVPSAEAVELFDSFLTELAGGTFRCSPLPATTIRRSASRSARGSWRRAACISRRSIMGAWSR